MKRRYLLTTAMALAVGAPGLAAGQPNTSLPVYLADAVRQERTAERQDREAERRQREREQAEREAERRMAERDRENEAYDRGQEALDSNRWDRAISAFDRVIGMKGSRADAALYWKAYAQNRLGQRNEALATLATLTKEYPTSRYLKEARVLEVEVRAAAGQPVKPESQSDEELKLIAIAALQNGDPEQYVPMLEKFLTGPSSPRLKERALFVLAQSSSPRARDALKNYAKGGSTPELQNKAIKYLGVHGGRENRAMLAELYGSTTDISVKREILRAFMVSGEKDRLLTAAQSEQNAELRAEAVRQLGAMGANDELWQMYQKETALDVKKQILQAMFVGGNVTRMIDLAKGEQNPELRRTAVRNLGLMGSKRTGDTLVEMYGTSKDVEVRKAVVEALFLQDNAASLVALARKESDPVMKKQIVQRLSLMRDKVAIDYMLELLNK